MSCHVYHITAAAATATNYEPLWLHDAMMHVNHGGHDVTVGFGKMLPQAVTGFHRPQAAAGFMQDVVCTGALGR